MTDPEPADSELLRRMRRDPQAVALVHDRHARRLVAYLRRRGATGEAALDATQETFARLIVGHRRIRAADDGSLWPWLAVTARNLVRDWQRRGVVDARARRRLGLANSQDEVAEAAARADARNLRPKLRLALLRLPHEQRTAVTARVIDELDYEEIAHATGASKATVRQRVSRGLHAMQTFLEGGQS